jgi:hypothetical protein
MKLILLSAFSLLNFQFAFCQWENLDTGLTDDLSGVVFFENNGLVSGTNGLYYTTTGGHGATSWKRFEITDNIEDAEIYENTSFTHCLSDISSSASTGFVFACGQNRITKQAIIMKIEIPSIKYEIIYIGEVNSKLNQIAYSESDYKYVAVGDKGLIVKFQSIGVLDAINIGVDNFSSISFYNGKCKIATIGKILYFDKFDYYYDFEETLTSDSNNNAIAYGSGNLNLGKTFSVGNRFAYYDIYNSLIINHTNYYNGSLNAKCISASSNKVYVGTDHGIYFVANGNNEALEWQSTSLNYTINCFWKQYVNVAVYACGNSGVVLKTIDEGGTSIPYVNISNIVGGCIGSNVILDAITGYVASCKWFVNNVEVKSLCGSLSYMFSKVGDYEIKHTVKNPFDIESTDIKTIYISPVPLINLPVSISDNVLCKSESINIQIQNSEINVVYSLIKEGEISNYGTSGVGNGQTITFTSNLINQSGNFYLIAKNINANCVSSFTDKFKVTVEHTQSDFHADLINAKLNETVGFYQKAIDAQNYKWGFSPNASIIDSQEANPVANFSNEGATKINLEVWSNNNCYDQIEREGPYIYKDPTNPNQCWTLVNDGVDSPWNGLGYEGIEGITPTTDGFLTYGGFNSQIFDSKTGLKNNLQNKNGSFITKHDRNGVLKQRFD